jgi:hypothetical protein
VIADRFALKRSTPTVRGTDARQADTAQAFCCGIEQGFRSASGGLFDLLEQTHRNTARAHFLVAYPTLVPQRQQPKRLMPRRLRQGLVI